LTAQIEDKVTGLIRACSRKVTAVSVQLMATVGSKSKDWNPEGAFPVKVVQCGKLDTITRLSYHELTGS